MRGLDSLPTELIWHILVHVAAVDLARARCACQTWARLARGVAEDVLRRRRRLPVACDCPCWIRSLAAAEALERAVGQNPESRGWRDEWAPMCREWYRLLASRDMGTDQMFEANGTESVSQKLLSFAVAIEQKLDAGWDAERAAAVSVIVPCGHIAIAQALHELDGRYAASTHMVIDSLFVRACLAEEPAPPLYAALEGEFGLATNGPEWNLLQPGCAIGSIFTTTAPVEAIVPDAHTIRVAGYHSSVNTGGVLSYKLAESDIVCILSSRARESGFHSLVQTATAAPSAEYMLPPMATVCLEKIEEPGMWSVRRRKVRRRLYTVSVSYG
uniref:F-box domain-containing protein n=1 Tax=Calcidiscus leptoporus TaxID=127549 RepID=A0A7S0NVR4_9EUKA|mmetsp:Transcript_31504/g.73329  ORF Transcript_31504/g.73329 Transcript_31504/m.73329 type:complete len:329 (+) Transcript_31504:59-1045(+)